MHQNCQVKLINQITGSVQRIIAYNLSIRNEQESVEMHTFNSPTPTMIFGRQYIHINFSLTSDDSNFPLNYANASLEVSIRGVSVTYENCWLKNVGYTLPNFIDSEWICNNYSTPIERIKRSFKIAKTDWKKSGF